MPRNPTTLVVANQKGGVGKTTTAINLAAGLARAGFETLLVDLDIQASATATLVPRPGPERNIAECLEHEAPLDAVIRPTSTERLWLAPSGDAMATVDIHLANAFGREGVLSRCLAATMPGRLDVIVVDTAPYLGLLTLNAIVAADHVLVPVTCEFLPILGLKLFNEMLAKVRARVGARAEVLGYLLTMYDRREAITVEVEGLLRRTFGDLVLPNPIRVSTRHKANASFHKTIFEHDRAGSRGRVDYELLTGEVIRRAHLAAEAEEAATVGRLAPCVPADAGGATSSSSAASSRGEDASEPRASSASA